MQHVPITHEVEAYPAWKIFLTRQQISENVPEKSEKGWRKGHYSELLGAG